MRFVKPPLIRRQTGIQLRLGLRNLFILPTRFGLLWLAAAGLLQLVAIQMRSNGTLLLSFLPWYSSPFADASYFPTLSNRNYVYW